jgi:hypothetical protein
VSPPRVKPWHPSAGSRQPPWRRGELTSSARLFSCACPAAVLRKQPRCQVSAIPRRVGSCATSAGCCRRPAGPLERLHGGAVVQGHQAHKGGEGHPPAVGRRASRPQHPPCELGATLKALRQASAPPRGEASTDEPPLGIAPSVVLVPRGWGLCHSGPPDKPCVRHRRSGTSVIRTVTTGWAGWPSAGAGLPLGRQRVRDIRPQRRDFGRGDPPHRPHAPGPWGHSLVAGHRPRRDAIMGRAA